MSLAADGEIVKMTISTKCIAKIDAWLRRCPRRPGWPSRLVPSFGAHRWFLAHGHLLKPAQHDAFSDFIDILVLVERQRQRLRQKIILANRSERFIQITELLQSVHGIADIWACIIAAEIGPFDRFPNADALQFWAGMTADLKESAGRTQSGNITKAGSRTLRWALCKAAVTLCRSDAKQEATRQRLIRQVGRPDSANKPKSTNTQPLEMSKCK